MKLLLFFNMQFYDDLEHKFLYGFSSSHSNGKVLFCLLFLPAIFWLEFKTREELLLQPQTAAEHEVSEGEREGEREKRERERERERLRE